MGVVEGGAWSACSRSQWRKVGHAPFVVCLVEGGVWSACRRHGRRTGACSTCSRCRGIWGMVCLQSV